MDNVLLGGILSILAFSVLLVRLLGRLRENAERDADLGRIERKLDLLLEERGLEYDPMQGLPIAIPALIKQGKVIEAIKAYREATGVGLKQAKDAIDEIRRRGSLP